MRYLKALLMLLMLPSLVSAQTAVLGPAANPASPLTVLSQSAIPFIKASSGTMGNNGAVSAMTALPRTYSGGAYIHLPANAISAGSSAGWYWFVASSTTAGTVYNSTYTSGIPRVGTATAFSTTGPGAFTGETGSDIAGPTITIPANLIGANGWVDARVNESNNNSANIKTTTVTFGASTCGNIVSSSTALNAQASCSIYNRGLTNAQSAWRSSTTSAGAVSAGNATDFAVNTTADVVVTFTVQAATGATDHAIIEAHSLIVYTRN